MNGLFIQRQCQMVSFTGAVASKKVSEAFKGIFILVGNQWKNSILSKCNDKVCFTERLINRSVTQVGYSDPMIQNGMIIAQEIKVTLGITGLSFARVHIVQTV